MSNISKFLLYGEGNPKIEDNIQPRLANTMYTWINNGGAIAMPIGDMAVSVDRVCKTTFTADANGTILAWRWEGNTCRA